MLEIVALIFLTKDIGKLAARKGLKPSTWKIYLVLGWILSEIIGVIVGIMIFGMHNLVSIVLMGLAFAFGHYFFLRHTLYKYEDYTFDDEFQDFGK